MFLPFTSVFHQSFFVSPPRYLHRKGQKKKCQTAIAKVKEKNNKNKAFARVLSLHSIQANVVSLEGQPCTKQLIVLLFWEAEDEMQRL